MSKASQFFRRVGARGSCVLLAKILLSLITVVFAASITIGSTTYQTEVGSVVSVPNAIVVTSISYFRASSNSSVSSCAIPVVFGLGVQIANTNITSGHWVYDVRVNSTSSTPVNHAYNVTFVLASSTYGPVCTKSAASVNSNLFVDCRFDAGTSLPSSPYTFKITSTL